MKAKRHFSERPGLVYWVASHCPTNSQRENFVQELKKHIKVKFCCTVKKNLFYDRFREIEQVDVFGGCSDNACDDECYRNLPKKYKFYLSFENNYCDDYITEKFFKMLKNRVVPIVLGEPQYY